MGHIQSNSVACEMYTDMSFGSEHKFKILSMAVSKNKKDATALLLAYIESQFTFMENVWKRRHVMLTLYIGFI